jgi:aminomethyltransferase
MLKTTLYDTHVAQGAKMVSFGGFMMPVQYEGVTKEHHCVRNGVGVFDVSHMGEFFVEGPQALSLLQHICSNDIEKLVPGKAQYNYLPNHSGGVVDDLIVYQLEEERYLLVVNASNIEKDWAWISKQNEKIDAQIRNASEEYSLLAVQGPKVIEAMQALTDIDLHDLPFYAHKTAAFAGVENILIATTGYTGSGGLELYIPNSEVQKVWDSVFKAGEAYGIAPIGLAARDTLRLEMGYCLYGNEINDEQSPIAAGLGWVTRPKTNFINSEALGKEKTDGTSDSLVGFELQERGIPRTGHELFDLEGKQIGSVTSGTQSPSLGKGIGLGYVPKEFSEIGTKIQLQVRKKMLAAIVVSLPFYKVK